MLPILSPVVFDFSVSGQDNLDMARAVGAAITDAVIKWLAGTWENMQQMNSSTSLLTKSRKSI